MQENQSEVAAVAAVEEKAITLLDVQTVPALQFINSVDTEKWVKLICNYHYNGVQIGEHLRAHAEPLNGDEDNEVVEAAQFFHMDHYQTVPHQTEVRPEVLVGMEENCAAVIYIRLRKPIDMAKGYIWANQTAARLLETLPYQPGSRCMHYLNVIKECCNAQEFFVGVQYHDNTVLQ